MAIWQRILATLALGGIIGFASERQYYVTPEVLDRLPAVFAFKSGETKILAALFSLAWIARLQSTLNPAYLVLPAAIWLTLKILERRSNEDGLRLTHAPAPAWRHFLFMLMPLLTALIATQGWQRFQNIESNWPIALLLTAIALGIYLLAAIAAVRTPYDPSY